MSLLTDISNLAPKSGLDPNIKTENKNSLDMDGFLQLIVAQFQNQDPENAADTSEMLNMLVQMSTVEAITNITDATTMMYTASLVGKEVTIGSYDANNNLVEIVGTVTGTGTFGGQPVVFVDGVSYYLSDIMAVGRLPPKEEPDENPDEDPDGTPPVDPDKPSDEKPPVDPDKPSDEKPPVDPDKPSDEKPPVDPDKPSDEKPPVDPDKPSDEKPPVDPDKPSDEKPPVDPDKPPDTDPKPPEGETPEPSPDPGNDNGGDAAGQR